MREDRQQPTAAELAPHRLGLAATRGSRARLPSSRQRQASSLPHAHQPWAAAPTAIPPAGVPFSAVIMFIDIRDSTTLTNLLGIIPMTRLVTGFFAKVASEVEGGGGSVCAFNGDGALALFRGPGAADRSVGTAIRILELACATPAPGIGADNHAAVPGHLMVGIGMDKGQVCQAVIPCSTAPHQSWIGVNTANKLASLGQPSQSIAMTEDVVADIADQRVGDPVVVSSDMVTRIGGIDLAVRTLSMQPRRGHAMG